MMLPTVKWFVTQEQKIEIIVVCEGHHHVEILESQGLSKPTAEIEHAHNNGAFTYWQFG